MIRKNKKQSPLATRNLINRRRPFIKKQQNQGLEPNQVAYMSFADYGTEKTSVSRRRRPKSHSNNVRLNVRKMTKSHSIKPRAQSSYSRRGYSYSSSKSQITGGTLSWAKHQNNRNQKETSVIEGKKNLLSKRVEKLSRSQKFYGTIQAVEKMFEEEDMEKKNREARKSYTDSLRRRSMFNAQSRRYRNGNVAEIYNSDIEIVRRKAIFNFLRKIPQFELKLTQSPIFQIFC